MNLDTLIKTRRTVHVYNTKPVAEALLNQALELALWAPNHRLTFPWRFVRAGTETRRQLAQVAAEIKAKKNGAAISMTEKAMIEKSYLDPSHLLVISMLRSPDPRRLREDYATVAMGVQNISLFLWQHQIGTKWSSGAPTFDARTYNILNVDPSQQEIVGFLWIGHFDSLPKETPRPELDKVLLKLP